MQIVRPRGGPAEWGGCEGDKTQGAKVERVQGEGFVDQASDAAR